ncbi:MAG TPA: ABC transporter substrate-binding protein [Chloroflexota bacterium]|nr:ABC transporter substrate-binding protein [Chloroflexota bacterium]
MDASRHAHGALLAGCLVAGLACTSSAPPATPASAPDAPAAVAAPAEAAPSATAPAALTPVAIVYATTSAANAFLQVAQDQGLFEAHGLDVELSYAAGNATPAAVLSGQAQAMVSGCIEAASAYVGSGGNIAVFMQPVHRMQYLLASGPSVVTPSDLRGKRLAVSRIGSSSHLISRTIVRFVGLDPDNDVSYVQIGNTPERVAALIAGSVDATILSLDEGALVGNTPGMRVLVDMTREAVPYCTNSLAVTQQFGRDQPDTVGRLTRALVEAIARFKRDKPVGLEATRRFLSDEDPQKVDSIWATWEGMYEQKPYPDNAGLQRVLDDAAASDTRLASVKAEQINEPRWVAELDQSGYLDQLYAGSVR